MWIKICGMTSAQAVSAALAACVDAIGFVFASSVRRISPQQAATLARSVRGRLPCVAVMRHPTQAELDEVVRVFSPDLLQTDNHRFGPPPPAGGAGAAAGREAGRATAGNAARTRAVRRPRERQRGAV